jgi:hypothetical protein
MTFKLYNEQGEIYKMFANLNHAVQTLEIEFDEDIFVNQIDDSTFVLSSPDFSFVLVAADVTLTLEQITAIIDQD